MVAIHVAIEINLQKYTCNPNRIVWLAYCSFLHRSNQSLAMSLLLAAIT